MRQIFATLLVLPILLPFLAVAPALAEKAIGVPSLTAGNSDSSAASDSSVADVYRLIRNTAAEIDRVRDALRSNAANGVKN